MSRIITLTTDFGLADGYVGVMKGVILTRAPAATIVDISHGVQRQNIQQGALLIRSAYKFFPKGTVHLVVVDPGVGSDRRIILLQADGHLFLAPDNGVLGLLLEDEYFEAAFEVQCEQFYLSPVSSTFHGRDIMAPVAAQLVAGFEPGEIGPKLSRQSLKKLVIAAEKIAMGQKKITGEIISVDHFGNLQTNIREKSLQEICCEKNLTAEIRIKNTVIIGTQKTYADTGPGSLLAITGSQGFLEIAVNLGNAAAVLGAGVGDPVEIEMIKR